MAKNPTRTTAAASAACDAVTALTNNGYLRIYDGVQPVSADTAITTQNKLAELRFANPAFSASVNGVATAHAITPDSNAPAAGTATWFRACKSDGTAVYDGSCDTADGDLILSTTVILLGAVVSTSALTLTENT